jgi:hypothetical protein
MAATADSGKSGNAAGSRSAAPTSAGHSDRNSVGKAKSRARKAAPDAAEEQAQSARTGREEW